MQLVARGLLLCVLISACSSSTPPATFQPDEAAPDHQFDVLVFSKTVGWRHDSIEAGIAAIKLLGKNHNFSVTATEESAFFTSEDLSRFEAILFLNTTLDVFNEQEQSVFQAYIRQGGGFVGIHAAADTEYDWEWYGGLVGAYFESHPDQQHADVLFTDRQHPATKNTPLRWNHFDEWYNYKANPRSDVHVLAVVSEKTYEGGNMGHDHPIAWAHHYDGGRAFYTGLGHTIESYSNPVYLDHILGGIEWAAGAVEADVTASLASSYEKVVLTGEITDPMEIDITRDGRVFITEWAGSIKIWEPDTNKMRVVGWLPVEKKIEDGLHGLALDPDFDNNGWIYIFYSPIAEDSYEASNRLSRFTYDGHMLDLASEITMLEIPVQRVQCCHSAGSVQFDIHGNLYLSTGDNSGGPRDDEDPTIRKHADQGRSAANTNDLRGKILRITPQPDGTYTIPQGNLFPPGTPDTRPEIYTMGHRNPYRFSIDSKNGWVYWGDVGPGTAGGLDEFNQARGPGFFGWPLFTGKNEPFTGYHVTGQENDMASFMNADAPVNASPFNTGLRALPPAQPAFIDYFYGTSEAYPELGAGGMNPMGGPIFHYNANTASPNALPAYFDDKVMIYEWMRHWLQVITLDEKGDILKIDPFLPGINFVRPMDIEVGPQGRLYVVEWGDEFWGSNGNAQLVRLDYHGSNEHPATMDKTLSTEGAITINSPADGSFFSFGEDLNYSVSLADQALADQVYIRTYTGFDTSPIPLEELQGLEGLLSISDKFTHTPDIHFVDRFAIVEACIGESAGATCDHVKLNPTTREAEHTSRRENATLKSYGAHHASKEWSGSALTTLAVSNDSRLEYAPVNLQHHAALTVRFKAEQDFTLNMSFETAGNVQSLASVDLNNAVGQAVEPPQAVYVNRVTEEEDIRQLNKAAYAGWREITIPVQAPNTTGTLIFTFNTQADDAVLELDQFRVLE